MDTLLCGLVAIGMVSLFINVQNEASYVDQLSGLFNRQYLNTHCVCIAIKGTLPALAGIMLDIDGFQKHK